MSERPDDWPRVKEIFAAALNQPPEARASYLAATCGGDDELRARVQALLESHEGARSFLETSKELPNDLQLPTPRLQGQRIGAYQVVARLGAGGMGEVYRARDLRLGRDVAIKILPEVFTRDPQRLARFEREARVLAALTHPNIGAIYGVEDPTPGSGPLTTPALLLELIEGDTLAERIAGSARDSGFGRRRGLQMAEAARIAAQIADALEAAHDKGIVHRDLKPANIKLTPAGVVKVLDFGLAKAAFGDEPTSSDMSQSPTMTSDGTRAGMILGTAAYMSPEQARGHLIDKRTDIWAFGCVLYEMLAGRTAFSGATVSDTIAAILERNPEWSALPSDTPESVRHLLRRCLEKDARRRLRDIGEARIELLDTVKVLEPGRADQGRRAVRIRSRFAMWVALPLMLAAAGYFVWQVWRGMNRDEPLRAVSLTTLPGVERHPSFSPDGDRVVFSWNGPKQDNRDVYVQQVGSGSPLRLTTDPLEDQMPVWSPDGRWIAFVRSSPAKTELRLIPPLGGPEKTLAEIQIRGSHENSTYLAWCPESDCLLVTDSLGIGKPDALFVVLLETGEKRQLTNPQPPVFGDASPAVSPDGSALLFLRDVAVYAKEAYWLPIGKGMTAGGEPRRIPVEGMKPAFPAWTPDGKDMLFSANGNLWRLSVSRGGRPARLPFVGQDGIMPAVSRAQNGRAPRLVYVRSQTDMNLWKIETPAPGVAAMSPPSIAISSTRLDNNPQFSPDGKRVAFCSKRAETLEIWLADPDGSNAIQLTSMGAPVSCAPRWSPDGQWIAFDSDREGQQEINVIAVSGGKYRRITSHPASDLVPSFSRNGQWIYFGSNRSGRMQIWKVPASGGEPVQVTTNGGNAAFESLDGTQLYFLNSGLWRMPVSGGPPVKILDGVVWLAYTVLDMGIYYIDNFSGESRLQFYDFASAKSLVVARNLGDLFLGLTASPDGRTILYTRVDLSIDDLMLVENFR